MSFKKQLLSKAEMKNVYCGDIRRFRDEKCLTQSYMAEELGIGQSAYQKIESGESKISIERLNEIARILGKPIDALLITDWRNEESISELESSSSLVTLTKTEHDLLLRIIQQQEQRIEELSEKVKRKNDKIEALKLQLGFN